MPDSADAETDALYWAIGQRIIAARKLRGVTQGRLADAIGMARTSVANIEAGRQRPPLHTLLGIAELLSLGITDLVGQDAAPAVGLADLATRSANAAADADLAYAQGWHDCAVAMKRAVKTVAAGGGCG